MAKANQLNISLSHCGEYHVPDISQDAAERTSQCLQDNHDHHHIFFNQSGFHNHISHHLLTLYALGANPSQIQGHYASNKEMQRPLVPIESTIVEQLYDEERFPESLGDEKHYANFLNFFQLEIDKKGVHATLNKYMLKRDGVAPELLQRMYAGFLHPLIHLGFGLEFAQTPIIAEALAQAAVHHSWIGKFLLPAEEAAASVTKSSSLISLIDQIRADDKLKNAAHWSDGNKIRDGIMVRAPDEMVKYASQWKVAPHELQEKTAEMINAAVYFTAASQRPNKLVKFDFYYMHCVNCSIFFSVFLKQDWMTDADKARLLEWKGRLDLAMYASRHCPELLPEEVKSYKPKVPDQDWEDLFKRVKRHEDDGHACKLVRALAHGDSVCEHYNGRSELMVQGEMWLKIANMVVDSVEGQETRWVRSTGFDEAWEEIEDRPPA